MARKKKAKTESVKCAKRGCRRVARDGDFCRKCGTTRARLDPSDNAVKLTGQELARLGKAVAEFETAQLRVRLGFFEVQELKREFERQLQEKLRAKDEERKLRAEELQRVKKIYDLLTLELSQKYGISDPKKMAVDTETGLIRDADTF